MKKTALAASVSFLIPFVAFAQSLTPISNLIGAINGIVARLVPLLIAVAMVAFFWGLIQYILGGGKGKQGKQIMIAGIGSLFVMVSIWGIILLGQQAFGINSATVVPGPAVPVTR